MSTINGAHFTAKSGQSYAGAQAWRHPSSPNPSDSYSQGSSASNADIYNRSSAPAEPPKPAPAQVSNPVVGTVAAPPRLTADASTSRPSPRLLPDEAAFFKETRSVIENAKPGDIVGVQMYEFENNATNSSQDDAPNAPGFADQQALLPALVDAAKRGVKVNLILDASTNAKTGQLNNQSIVDYLNKQAGSTGNLTIDYYPPAEVNIDHAKQLVYLAKSGDGSYDVKEAIGGGSNWGNHTAANNDGGAAFYGVDGLESAEIFFQNQAHCRGQQVTIDAPPIAANAPVRWTETSPTSHGILDAKLAFLRQSDEAYEQQFVLTQRDVSKELDRMGPNAHALFDSGESKYDQKNFSYMQGKGADVKWSNTTGGAKLHRKEAVYLKNGNIIGGTIGSANETNAGLETPYDSTFNGQTTHRLTNHELDAVVTAYTSPDGKYSTMPLLQGMLQTAKANLAQGLNQPAPGSGDSEVF